MPCSGMEGDALVSGASLLTRGLVVAALLVIEGARRGVGGDAPAVVVLVLLVALSGVVPGVEVGVILSRLKSSKELLTPSGSLIALSSRRPSSL